MASKKRYFFENFFNRAKNSAAAGEKVSRRQPCKKEGHFSPSFENDGHYHIETRVIRANPKL